MAEIAAAAQHDLDRATEVRGAERGRHLIEILRAAGAQDDRPRRKQILAGARPGKLDQVLQESRDLRFGIGYSADHILEAFDADQRELRHGGDRACHPQGFLPGPTARAAAGHAALEQDLEWSPERHLLQLAPQQLDALQGIDQAQELEAGVGLQLGEDGADRLAPDQLIGHEHTRHAEPTAHHQLLHGGDGDAPGAIGELPGEQLRRHGGLAVRAQAYIEVFEKAAHPAAVVGERGSLEHRDRERQVLAQQVPALAPGGAQRQRSGQRRPALGGKRYRRVQQLVQVHRKSPHPACVTSGGIIVRRPADRIA